MGQNNQALFTFAELKKLIVKHKKLSLLHQKLRQKFNVHIGDM